MGIECNGRTLSSRAPRHQLGLLLRGTATDPSWPCSTGRYRAETRSSFPRPRKANASYTPHMYTPTLMAWNLD